RGETVCERHADGHTLAMDQPASIVAGCSLQRVAKRMAEIEQGAIPTFALIACNHLGLRLAGFCDRMLARLASGKNIAPIHLQPLEEGRAVDQAVFDCLRIARAKLPF